MGKGNDYKMIDVVKPEDAVLMPKDDNMIFLAEDMVTRSYIELKHHSD